MIETIVFGQVFRFNTKTLGLSVDDRSFDRAFMEAAAKEYKGANRLYKPMALLFWTDCKNGQYSNWKTTKI